jgi:hypothetical protein
MAKKKNPIFAYLFFSLSLLGLAGLIYLAVFLGEVFLGWGSAFHNTTTVADFNGDGRLDVVVAHARYESESAIFAHTTLWTNQANGRFSPQRIAYIAQPRPETWTGMGMPTCCSSTRPG